MWGQSERGMDQRPCVCVKPLHEITGTGEGGEPGLGSPEVLDAGASSHYNLFFGLHT